MRILLLMFFAGISFTAGAQESGFWGIDFGASKETVKDHMEKKYNLKPINETANQFFYAPEKFNGFHPDETVVQFDADKMVVGYADYTVDKPNLNATYKKLKEYVKRSLGKPALDLENVKKGMDLVSLLDTNGSVVDAYIYKSKGDDVMKTLVLFKAGVTNGVYFVTLQYEDMSYYQATAQHKQEG